MMYRTSDGMTFTSYTSMCDHMIAISRDPEMKEYYRSEKEKMIKRQRSIGSRIMLFFMLPVTLPICTLIGHPENAINAVFGED
jgi:hypothetical protein